MEFAFEKKSRLAVLVLKSHKNLTACFLSIDPAYSFFVKGGRDVISHAAVE